MSETTTAYQDWDRRWQSDEGRAAWLTPDPNVDVWARRIRARGGTTALDLGCGVGRHTVLLAQLEYRTAGLDASETGLDHTRRALAGLGLGADLRRGHMTALPFADGVFDYVLAQNVIYHGDGLAVRSVLAEIRRVLHPHGIFQGTMLSKRNARYGKGAEIAPDTFVDRDAGGDKAHPHFYCSALELVTLFDGFEVLALEDREQKGPGTWHWHVVAELGANAEVMRRHP